MELNPKTMVKLYKKLDYHRKPEITELLTLICQADSQGRLTFENRDYPQREYVNRLFSKIKQMDLSYIYEMYKNDIPKMIENIYVKRVSEAKREKEKIILDLSLSYDLEKIMKFNPSAKKIA